MTEQADNQLLREYAERKAESAFAELVRRHVDFVYSAALRMIRDTHLAEDVTQGVFVALAQNAPRLLDRAVLSGWLHRTTQNIAAQTVRTIERRRAREQEAIVMNELLSAGNDASWKQVAPHLDAALGELSEPDRDALLLRYFERKSARDIAQTLGISDEAAQKRVSRAVEKLREVFSKRGIAIGGSGLVVLISANAVQSAPVKMSVTISAAALAGTTTTPALVATTTKTIAMTVLQKTLIAVTIAVVAGMGIYEANQNSKLHEQVQSLQQQQAPLEEQIRDLQRERDDATNQLAGFMENAQLKSPSNGNELLKLRGKVAVLQNQIDAASQSLEAVKRLGYTPAEVREYFPTNFPLNMPTVGLAYMGYSQPEAALETLLWAFRRGSQQVIMETLSSQKGFQNWQKLLNADSTDQFAKRGVSFMDNVAWVNLTKKEVISDNEISFTIFIVPNSGTANGIAGQITVKKIQDKWQVQDLSD